MNQANFTFRICYVTLPQDRIGYVHFAMSKRNNYFGYVDTTMCLRSTLFRHKPYVLIAYMCVFKSNKNKMCNFVRAWNDERTDEILLWPRNGRNIIQHYADLNLIYLMRE